MCAVNEWTVPWLVRLSARDHPDRIALEGAVTRQMLTYEELLAVVEQRSLQLASRFPVGSRIAVILESGYLLSAWLLSTMWRHVAVPLSPAMVSEDLDTYLLLTKTEGIVTTSDNELVANLAKEHGLEILLVDVPHHAASAPVGNPRYPGEDDIAAILLTSGTTSGPKVVPLSHGNLTVGASNVCESLNLNPGDRCLVLWAQHHIGGIVDLLLAPLFSGGTVVNGGTYSSEAFTRLAYTTDPQWIQFVPTTLAESVKELEKMNPHKKLTGLRFVRCVAAPLSDSLGTAAEQAFGCRVVHTYGLTEASPLVTSTRLHGARHITGSSGLPIGAKIVIVGEGNQSCEVGAEGQIVIRGRNVFSGYEGSADRSEDFTPDGGFKTGDLGYLNIDGELFVTGRKERLVNRGGRKISPSEVERILLGHPQVLDAIAFGRPHVRLGEALVAVVESENHLDVEQLRRFLEQATASEKIPDYVSVVSRLPRNATGKVAREKVYEIIEDSLAVSRVNEMSSLEQEIFQMWAEELDAEDFDIDTPFVIAGGDSLSVVRMVAELEQRFGLPISENYPVNSMTIRHIALTIDAALSATTPKRSTNGLLSTSPTWLSDESVESFGHQIANEQNSTAHLLLQEAALTLLAPSEITQLIEHIEQRSVTLRSDSPLRKWAAQPDPMRWQREVLSASSMHYHVGRDHTCGDVLVGFTGNQGRLLLPIHLILSNLPSRFCRLVLLTDLTRDHYQRGIPGIGHDAKRLSAGLERILPAEWLRSAAFLGTSAGAVAALVCGLDQGSRRIGLVGPDSPMNRPLLKTALESTLGEYEYGHVNIAVGQTRRDLQGLKDLQRLMPSLSGRVFARAGHNVFLSTHRRRKLNETLNWLLRAKDA